MHLHMCTLKICVHKTSSSPAVVLTRSIALQVLNTEQKIKWRTLPLRAPALSGGRRAALCAAAASLASPTGPHFELYRLQLIIMHLIDSRKKLSEMRFFCIKYRCSLLMAGRPTNKVLMVDHIQHMQQAAD